MPQWDTENGMPPDDEDEQDFAPVDFCPECGDDDFKILHTVEDEEDGWYDRLECHTCGTQFDGHRKHFWE